MKALRYGVFAMAVSLAAIASAQTASRQAGDRERLIGAWRLVHIESPGPDGKPADTPQPIGMLLYTRDGHISVQLMYPKAAAGVSNEYVRSGYEASFGSYDIDEAAHRLTHHVLGSNTGDLLVGKNLPRAYQFNDKGQLVIRSANPGEHWFVVWEHY